MQPDLKKAFEDALFEKVEIKKADKKIYMSKVQLGLEQLVNQFAKGDRYARRDLFQYAALLGVDLQGKEVIAEALGFTEQMIVDAFLQRQQSPAPAAVDNHVKAPPDLLDDDVVEPPSKAKEAAPAPPRAPLNNTPPRKGPHTRESIQADRERHLAWLKKVNGS